MELSRSATWESCWAARSSSCCSFCRIDLKARGGNSGLSDCTSSSFVQWEDTASRRIQRAALLGRFFEPGHGVLTDMIFGGSWDVGRGLSVRSIAGEIAQAARDGLAAGPARVQSGNTSGRLRRTWRWSVCLKRGPRAHVRPGQPDCLPGRCWVDHAWHCKNRKTVISIADSRQFHEHIDDHQTEILHLFANLGSVLPWQGIGDLVEGSAVGESVSSRRHPSRRKDLRFNPGLPQQQPSSALSFRQGRYGHHCPTLFTEKSVVRSIGFRRCASVFRNQTVAARAFQRSSVATRADWKVTPVVIPPQQWFASHDSVACLLEQVGQRVDVEEARATDSYKSVSDSAPTRKTTRSRGSPICCGISCREAVGGALCQAILGLDWPWSRCWKMFLSVASIFRLSYR